LCMCSNSNTEGVEGCKQIASIHFGSWLEQSRDLSTWKFKIGWITTVRM
jgi:hypothetical protein